MDNNKLETIQAVDRAFQILELISQRGNMSLNELHKEIGVNKASLLRLAYTLTQNGYLTKHPVTGDYAMTMKTYQIGLGSVQNADKFSLINSTLMDLNAATGRIAQFSVEDNNECLCLQSIGQRTSFFSVYTNVGKTSPMYCTSAGKAILSTYSNQQILEKWEKYDIEAYTENTITDPQDFLKEIMDVRIKGYALDRKENEFHVYCVGAVVMGYGNSPVGALSISGSTLTEEEEKQIADVLLPAAQKLSALMGYI